MSAVFYSRKRHLLTAAIVRHVISFPMSKDWFGVFSVSYCTPLAYELVSNCSTYTCLFSYVKASGFRGVVACCGGGSAGRVGEVAQGFPFDPYRLKC
jgi:hypothetical protein